MTSTFLLAVATDPASHRTTGFIVLILAIILIALLFDFLNGFHDAANSIATVVSTRVLSPTQAVAWAAFFNFAAAFVFGTGVAKTIGSGMMDTTHVDEYVLLAGLAGACIWNIITWLLALPTSSSHALIAGYGGAAVAKNGFSALIWSGWWPTLLWIFLAPIVGLILGMALMVAVAWTFRKFTPWRVDHLFRKLQLVSAGIYSLAHGGNDAQKTMGIIVALLATAGLGDWIKWGHMPNFHLFGTSDFGMPIILACHAAIALGTMFGGWRIVKTMGSGITKLQPVGGFCAEGAAAATIIFATFNKIPLSTTHAITGAIMGVGITKSPRSVRWIWGQRIILAWILTIPCTAFIAAVTWMLVHYTLEPWMR